MTNRLATLALAVAGLALLTSVATASQAITLDDVSLLSAPIANSASHGHVGQGSKVGVVWCGDEVGFCLVQFHTHQGFVAIAELELIGLDQPDDVSFGGKSQKAPGAEGPHMAKGVASIIINNNTAKQVAMP